MRSDAGQPDDLFGHSLDKIWVIAGAALGSSGGGCLGAVTAAFARGGALLGGVFLGALLAAVWAFHAWFQSLEDLPGYGVFLLALLACPLLFGLAASAAVRWAERDRAGGVTPPV